MFLKQQQLGPKARNCNVLIKFCSLKGSHFFLLHTDVLLAMFFSCFASLQNPGTIYFIKKCSDAAELQQLMLMKSTRREKFIVHQPVSFYQTCCLQDVTSHDRSQCRSLKDVFLHAVMLLITLKLKG